MCCGVGGSGLGACVGGWAGIGGSRLDDCHANDLTKNAGALSVCGGVVREAVYLFLIFFLVQLVGMTFFILVVTVGG